MNYKDLKEYFGTDEKIAVAIGVSHATVRKWKLGKIPPITQLAFQLITKNKLKADGLERVNRD